MHDDTQIGGRQGAFPVTRWTAVERSRSAEPAERREGFDALIAVYWKPIYKYLRLRWRRSNEDAKDLTQEFFARMISSDLLERYDPAQARLRTFLRTCLDRQVHNSDRDASRLKRGGDATLVPMDFVAAEAELARVSASPETSMDEVFEREWIRSLFGLAVDALREECEARNRELDFKLFERYDLDMESAERPTYSQLATEFGVKETTVTNRLAAARRRFRTLVLDRLRQMTGSEEEFRREARSVLGVAPG